MKSEREKIHTVDIKYISSIIIQKQRLLFYDSHP